MIERLVGEPNCALAQRRSGLWFEFREIEPGRAKRDVSVSWVVKAGVASLGASVEGVQKPLDQLTGLEEEGGRPLACDGPAGRRSSPEIVPKRGDEFLGAYGAPAVPINEHDGKKTARLPPPRSGGVSPGHARAEIGELIDLT